MNRRQFLKSIGLLSVFSLFSHPKIEGEPRYFESVEEAQKWIDDNTFVVGGDPTYDCGDYSQDWQRMAIRDGYIISEQLIEGGYLLGKHVSSITERHAGGLVKIGEAYYYFETYPSKDSWQLIYVDKERFINY